MAQTQFCFSCFSSLSFQGIESVSLGFKGTLLQSDYACRVLSDEGAIGWAHKVHTCSAWDSKNKAIHYALVNACNGKAMTTLKNATRGDGAGAWAKLVRKYEPNGGATKCEMNENEEKNN